MAVVDFAVFTVQPVQVTLGDICQLTTVLLPEENTYDGCFVSVYLSFVMGELYFCPLV